MDSPECSSYFWCRPSEMDSDSDSRLSPYNSNMLFESEGLSYFIRHPSRSSSRRSNSQGVERSFWDSACHQHEQQSNKTSTTSTAKAEVKSVAASNSTTLMERHESTASGNKTPSTTLGNTSAERYKRRQTKMLLVSLIESFCRIYGDSPDANPKVFFLICQTLASVGMIDAEFIDDMVNVRTAFQRTFHELFYAALHTVQTDSDQPYCRLLSTANSTFSNTTMVSALPLDPITPSPIQNALFDLGIHHSRYHTDFVELGLLGRGGFADAYRVKNTLDGIDYAIKKVPMGQHLHGHQSSAAASYKKIFREIKHLARLEHPNVIRYYASWLEYCAGQTRDTDPNDDSSNSVKHVQDGDGLYTGDYFDEHAPLQQIYPKTRKSKELLYQQGSISPSCSPSTTTSKATGEWILFIQMQLCQTTLYDYIEIRNRGNGVVDPKRNIALLTQILQGTDYIHQQGLIHRDLKPSNIFLMVPQQEDDDDNKTASRRILYGQCMAKIGDFGLAAALVEDEEKSLVLPNVVPTGNPSTLKEKMDSSKTTTRPFPRRTRTYGVGTRTYASPEQLSYSGRPYDEKVDIYSLGIIFFELYQQFTTSMERADAISNLKKAMLPDGFVEQYPKESALILWMMDHNPERRPSVKQVLNYELFTQTPTDMLATLTAKLQAKSEALDTLQVDMKQMEMDRQLERDTMQRRLNELQQKLDSISPCT